MKRCCHLWLMFCLLQVPCLVDLHGHCWSCLLSLRFVFLLYSSLFLIELLVSEMGGLTAVAYTELLIFFHLRCKGPARFFIGWCLRCAVGKVRYTGLQAGTSQRHLSPQMLLDSCLRILIFFFNANLNLFDAVGALRNIVAPLITWC